MTAKSFSTHYRFISGGWLETWTYCRAVQILTGGYACVRNLNVMLPGDESSEFDMMICARVIQRFQMIGKPETISITSSASAAIFLTKSARVFT